MQSKLNARQAQFPNSTGYDYPDGNNGLGGGSFNFDAVVGSSFADGRGHATAWVTYRQNDPLFQGERDYSSCALDTDKANSLVPICGGSGTAGNTNYFLTIHRRSGCNLILM